MAQTFVNFEFTPLYGHNQLYYLNALIKKAGRKKYPLLLRKASKKRMRSKKAIFCDTKYKLLDISTPEGMNQCCHPDLIEIENEKYIMTLTPYPFGDDRFERPVIYRSNNLLEWERITDYIDEAQSGDRNHLSDPTLTSDKNGNLICYYRECVYNVDKPETNIYKMVSNDNGISWGNKTYVISECMDDYDIISPSVKRNITNQQSTYFCLKKDGEMKLIYTNDKICNKENWKAIDLADRLPDGKILWHVAHIPYKKNEDILLLTLSDGFGGGNSQLFLGLIDNVERKLVYLKKIDIEATKDKILAEYRSTGIIKGDIIHIIASVMYDDKTWGCIYFEEKLFATEICE